MNNRTSQILVQRRRFLKAAAATLSLQGFGTQALAMQDDSDGGIATRPLGRTGERVPIVGLGGYHIGVPEEKEAISIMHEAIDQGMTFFDNAWDYHDGGSEEVMGKALSTGGRRDKVFLMTKVCDRDYQGAKQHLEDSLRRLKTDRIDLWQFHEINWAVDSEWVFEKGGTTVSNMPTPENRPLRVEQYRGGENCADEQDANENLYPTSAAPRMRFLKWR